MYKGDLMDRTIAEHDLRLMKEAMETAAKMAPAMAKFAKALNKLGEEVDSFGGQCHVAYGCNERQGAGKWCRDETCQHRMIWKDIADKERRDSGPLVHDVAKERWKWLRFETPLCEDILCIPDQDGKRGQRLAIRASATEAQIAVIRAAPEMLDVLSELEGHVDDTEGAYPPDKMILMLDKSLFQRVHDTIAKARGGDSE